jgi:hypothetical protein
MFQKLFTRRRAVAVATVALGISGMSLAFAGVAGATDPNPSSSLIVGSGSNTAYALMVAESALFNSSPGCDLTGAGADAPNLNCGTDPVAPGDAQVNALNSGENGFSQADENPYNDFTVQAPAVGSGAGVNQLNSGTGFQPDYARSSANPAGSNGTGAQNYEAYAVDGISWTAFGAKGSTLYPAHYVHTLTLAQITSIWAGNLAGCTKSGHTFAANNWGCLTTGTVTSAEYAVVNKPIDCYIPQAGSGTAGTWAGDFGYNKKETTGLCLSDSEGDGRASEGAASHINLFENQMAQIASGKVNGHTNNDQANAIYFMSYGKFKATCTGITAGSATAPITGKCAGATAYTTVLGDMTGGSPVTTQWPGEVVSGTNNIQGLGGGAYASGHEWLVLRNLFNVYNNSTSPRATSQAALNLVSEYGFMCKPGTVGDYDPLTGVNYRTEIESNILRQGFYPIDTSILKPFKEGSVTNPAGITDTFYQDVDKTLTNEAGTGPGSATTGGNGIPTGETNSASDPYGFCLQSNG